MALTRYANLVSHDSPNRAFYRLWLIADGDICVIKQSGAKGRVYDERRWPFRDLETASAAFERKLKQKLNPVRKSARHYCVVDRMGY